MTSSYQSTAFQSSAGPVDTFVRQSTVPLIEDDGFTQLTKALSAVNPVLDFYMKKTIEDEQAEGMDIALEEAKTGLRKVVTDVRKKNGDEAARQLVGGSIFADRAYQKTKANLLGGSASRNIQSLYETYTVPQMKNGEEIQVPIYNFSVDSDEYQQFLQEASRVDESALQGINSRYVNEFYFPQQQRAISSITSKHIKQNNEYKYERTKNLALPTVFDNLQPYINGEKDESLQKVNDYIEENVILGLPGDKQLKFFNTLLDVGESAISRQYSITGKTSDIDTAIEYLGNFNYGPGGTTKLKSHPEFETKFLKLKNDLNDQKDKDQKRQLEKIQAVENKTIETIIQKYPDDPAAAEALLNAFPFRKQKILETVEIFETDRTSRYRELQLDVGAGLYSSRPDEAQEELRQIYESHGGSATEEDDTNYRQTLSIIQNYKKAQTVNFTSRTTKTVSAGNRRAGAKVDANGFSYYPEDIEERASAIEELNLQFSRDVTDQIDNAIGLSNTEKEQLYRQLEDAYYREIDVLVAGGEKEFERRLEIQALVDDSGFTTEQVELFLSGEGNEMIFEPTTSNVEPTENETINEPGGTNRSFFDFFRKTNQSSNILNNIGDIANQIISPPVSAEPLTDQPFPDFGGLAELVRGGESAGSGLYNAYNGGTTDSAGEMDITSKTKAEIEQMQANDEVFAVGAYQFTPGVLREARIYSGIDKETVMTPAVQDRLFWGMLLSGRKRPALSAYLLGESDDLQAAHEDLALEFAAIQGPDGKGMYDNDKAGNYATIDAMTVRQTLINARNLLMNR